MVYLVSSGDYAFISRRKGGFIAFRVENAQVWSESLRKYKVFTDARGSALRFGPAPYLFDSEIQEAVARTLELYQERSCR